MHLGAHEQRSPWSTTSKVALGRLHIIGFAFVNYYLNDVGQWKRYSGEIWKRKS